MSRLVARSAVVLAALCAAAQPPHAAPAPPVPRPIAAVDTVFMEEMTWMEVRDALLSSKTTVLVPTGGIEQNGPYLATGKHNIILRATTESIARRLGNALVAPIVPFVPEGNIDPPTGHMRYPGTVSVTEETYERLLVDICSCMRTHGFRNVVLLGDSGGNQKGMKAVAARLNAKWAGGPARVHFIAEYYNYDAVDRWLEQRCIRQTDEGLHDDFAVTAQMMVVAPVTVRMEQRLAVCKFHINGLELAPAERTIAWGKKIIDFRAEATVRAIRLAVAAAAKR